MRCLTACKSSAVSTPPGALSISATAIRIPASKARNCSNFSADSSGEGGKQNAIMPAGANHIHQYGDICHCTGWYAGPAEIERVTKTMVLQLTIVLQPAVSRPLHLLGNVWQIAIILVKYSGKRRHFSGISGKSPCKFKIC